MFAATTRLAFGPRPVLQPPSTLFALPSLPSRRTPFALIRARSPREIQFMRNQRVWTHIPREEKGRHRKRERESGKGVWKILS